MKSTLSTAGRILFALPLLGFGFGHLTNANAMSGMVPLPGGVFWVYLTGVALVAAAVSIIIQKKAGLASLLLGIMLLIFIVAIHVPNMTSSDPTVQMMGMTNTFKDLGLAGASFYMSGQFKN
ncbi:MAG TPA: hypothetical protein VL443_08955 [Cyclobacteriaceae bacterium]|nr:hypothetical protein [Cyclobacteriaceae bacterium]